MKTKNLSMMIALLSLGIIPNFAQGANQASGTPCLLAGASNSSGGPVQGTLQFKPTSLIVRHVTTASGGYDVVQMDVKAGARFNLQEVTQPFKLSFRLVSNTTQNASADAAARQKIAEICVDHVRNALLTGFWVGIEETGTQGFENDPSFSSCAFRLRKNQAMNTDPPAAPTFCGLIPSQAGAPVVGTPPPAQQNQQTN